MAETGKGISDISVHIRHVLPYPAYLPISDHIQALSGIFPFISKDCT